MKKIRKWRIVTLALTLHWRRSRNDRTRNPILSQWLWFLSNLNWGKRYLMFSEAYRRADFMRIEPFELTNFTVIKRSDKANWIIKLFDFIVMRMMASFVMVILNVVGCFVTKLKELGNGPKCNEKTACYIFIVLKHFWVYKIIKNPPIHKTCSVFLKLFIWVLQTVALLWN